MNQGFDEFRGFIGSAWAVRKGSSKRIGKGEHPQALYDLKNDLSEKKQHHQTNYGNCA
jgi:hypothetical protein